MNSINFCFVIKSVVGSINYGSLLQWEKVPSLSEADEVSCINISKTIFERTIHQKLSVGSFLVLPFLQKKVAKFFNTN